MWQAPPGGPAALQASLGGGTLNLTQAFPPSGDTGAAHVFRAHPVRAAYPRAPLHPHHFHPHKYDGVADRCVAVFIGWWCCSVVTTIEPRIESCVVRGAGAGTVLRTHGSV